VFVVGKVGSRVQTVPEVQPGHDLDTISKRG